MKLYLAVGLAVALSGCVHVRETYLPDGTKGMRITCNGISQTMGACIEKAGQICGANGYNVIGAGGEKSAFATGGASSQVAGNAYGFAGSSNSGFYAGSSERRDMFIQCRNGVEPELPKAAKPIGNR